MWSASASAPAVAREAVTTVSGRSLGSASAMSLRGEPLVDEHGLGVPEQLGRGARDPALLGHMAGGAEGERRLEPGALHGVGAAVGAADQAVVLQAPVASYGLLGDAQFRRRAQ